MVGRPGFYGTKTNSAQTEAGARDELGNEQSITVQMDEVVLSESVGKCEKLLGVVFQSNLKWNKHIQDL